MNFYSDQAIPMFPKEIYILIHGFGSSKDSKINTFLKKMLNENNIGVITINLPQHGKTKYNPFDLTINNCLKCIDETYNFIYKKYPNIRISIFGSSFGGLLVLLDLENNKHKYNNIFLRSPAINMVEVLNKYGIYDNSFFSTNYINLQKNDYDNKIVLLKKFYDELKDINIYKIANNINFKNVTIIHGEKDVLVKKEIIYDFSKKYNIKLLLLKNIDHNFDDTNILYLMYDKIISIMK